MVRINLVRFGNILEAKNHLNTWKTNHGRTIYCCIFLRISLSLVWQIEFAGWCYITNGTPPIDYLRDNYMYLKFPVIPFGFSILWINCFRFWSHILTSYLRFTFIFAIMIWVTLRHMVYGTFLCVVFPYVTYKLHLLPILLSYQLSSFYMRHIVPLPYQLLYFYMRHIVPG